MTPLPRHSWRQLHFARPLDAGRALQLVRRLAADAASHQLALEVRATSSGVRYLIAASPTALDEVTGLLQALLPGSQLTPLTDDEPRRPVRRVQQLRASTRHRPLRVDEPEASSRAILGALSAVREREELVIQLVLGPRRVPLASKFRRSAGLGLDPGLAVLGGLIVAGG